ncbi:hypothetical protein MNEG_14180, partial [Monoraphidium neglectum]
MATPRAIEQAVRRCQAAAPAGRVPVVTIQPERPVAFGGGAAAHRAAPAAARWQPPQQQLQATASGAFGQHSNGQLFGGYAPPQQLPSHPH